MGEKEPIVSGGIIGRSSQMNRHKNLGITKNYPPIYSDALQYAFPAIEIFIVQDELIDKLDSNEIHLLYETVREINILKVDKVSHFFMGQMESTALMGKILLKVNYSPFVEFYNDHEQISVR